MDLSPEQVMTMLAHFVDPALLPQELRRAQRIPCNRPATILLDYNAPHERQMLVILKDFSPRGAGIISTKPLPRGEQFVLQMNAPTGAQSVLLCTVAHCR